MHKFLLFLVLPVCYLIVSACGGSTPEQSGDLISIRQARPTFTPTLPPPPAPTVANPGTDASQNGGAAGEPAVSFAPGLPEKMVITAQLVNARTAPNTNSDILGEIGRGQEFDIVAQNEAGDWWQACCYDQNLFWVFGELVETIGGDPDTVVAQPTVAQPTPVPAVPTATPAPPTPTTVVAVTNTPAAPASTPTWTPVPTSATVVGVTEPTESSDDGSGFPFDMRLQEQFPENNVVRVFLYVYNEEVQALEGYSLRVTKDGAELPVTEKSFGPQAGFTWPIAEDRQRFQNMKAEFPGEPAGGTWVVQLLDREGKLAGPPATFELTNNSQEQELYIRYEQK